jgi:hypothetical protein
MPYVETIKPWLVIRHLPGSKNAVMGLFKSPQDAEGYRDAMKRLEPDQSFEVVFNYPVSVVN